MAPGPVGHILMAKYEGALSAGISAALELMKEGKRDETRTRKV